MVANFALSPVGPNRTSDVRNSPPESRRSGCGNAPFASRGISRASLPEQLAKIEFKVTLPQAEGSAASGPEHP
jgi:hypothetical protein